MEILLWMKRKEKAREIHDIEMGFVEDDCCVEKCMIKMGMGCPIICHNTGIISGGDIGGIGGVEREACDEFV